MSDTPEEREYGQRLAAYIDQRRGYTSIRKFAALHGLDNARISAWRKGRTPNVAHLRPTAQALDLTIAELLEVMGVGDHDDFVVREPSPLSERAAQAASTADELTDEEWRGVQELLDVIRRLRAGNDSVTNRPGKSARNGRKSP